VPIIEPLWRPHAHRRLVEPFCGGLAVALGLAPERALLNDANPHLINFYRWVKRGLTVDLPMQNDRALFYRHRQRFNELVRARRYRTRDAASLFYFLNRTGYNGLCRFNSRGEFNVPFGRYATIGYVRDFARYQPAFAGWEFISGDLVRVPLDGDDFVYADPPSTWSSRTIRGRPSGGTIRCAPPNTSRAIPARCSWSTRRPSASGVSTNRSATISSSSRRRAGSTARATARRPGK
jgi:DNA adenine methylase Dam